MTVYPKTTIMSWWIIAKPDTFVLNESLSQFLNLGKPKIRDISFFHLRIKIWTRFVKLSNFLSYAYITHRYMQFWTLTTTMYRLATVKNVLIQLTTRKWFKQNMIQHKPLEYCSLVTSSYFLLIINTIF